MCRNSYINLYSYILKSSGKLWNVYKANQCIGVTVNLPKSCQCATKSHKNSRIALLFIVKESAHSSGPLTKKYGGNRGISLHMAQH